MRLILILLPLILAANIAHGYEVAFNCGGTAKTMDGKFFIADTNYPGSSAAGYLSGGVSLPNLNASFGGPWQPPEIFSRFRRGDISYQFDVPNGDYAVTLYFSEYNVHGPGLRQFPIQFNTTMHESAFDIWARSRMFYAFSARYKVQVTDGVIVASCGSGTEEAVLAGIAVEDILDEGLLPSAPENAIATGSYEAVKLTWTLPEEVIACGVVIMRSNSPTGPFEQVGVRSDLAPFWVDENVTPGGTYYYQLATTGLYENQSLPSSTVSAVVLSIEESTLPFYSITMSPEDLAALRQAPNLDLYYDAQLTRDGWDYGDSGVRYRGSLSRTISSKKSWKIKPDNQLVDGRNRINLNSDYLDMSQMVPLVAFACFRNTRCLAPEAQKANLMVNGEYRGLFSEVEQIDELFMEARGASVVGNIYKCSSDLSLMGEYWYSLFYEKKTNTSFGNEDLVQFIEKLNTTPASELDDTLFPLLNLTSLVDYYATRIYTADYDFFVRNYYLYHDLATDRWEIIPWDLDLGLSVASVLSAIDLGTSQTPSVNGWNRLWDRLISVPKFRRFYCDRLAELLDTSLAPEAFSQVVDSVASQVGPETSHDFWKHRFDEDGLFSSGLFFLHVFGERRHSYLQSAIEPFLASVNGLFINEVLVLNTNTLADEEQQYDSYIELFNWSDEPVNLADYSLGNGDLDVPTGGLPADSLAPRSFALFWADGEPHQGAHHLPFDLEASGGQIMLYHNSNLSTAIDSLSYSDQVPDVSLAVPVDGWWPFENAPPTPGATNAFQGSGPTLYINEFMALNTNTVADPQGEFEDWVELYNPGTVAVNLTGYHLSDDANFPTRWEFPPGTIIAPNGFLIVWCDADPLDPGLHTNFKLNASGESIGLFGPTGAGNPVIDVYVFGSQTAGFSEGRLPDGDPQWEYFPEPTPGLSNASHISSAEDVASGLLSLDSVSPNPSAGQTSIGFSVPGRNAAYVELAVFDVRGRRVRQILQGDTPPGQNILTWDRRGDGGRILPSGVYFVRLRSQGQQVTRKVMLVR